MNFNSISVASTCFVHEDYIIVYKYNEHQYNQYNECENVLYEKINSYIRKKIN